MKRQVGFREALRKAGPYPYTIKGVVCPDRVECNGLDPWAVLEFIRIEALLRSGAVDTLYKKHENGKNSLEYEGLDEYGVWGGWKTLEGFHHYLLSKTSLKEEIDRFTGSEPDEEDIDVADIGITDHGALLRARPNSVESRADQIKQLMIISAQEPDERTLWLEIDRNVPKKWIDKFLKARLNKTRRLEHIECPFFPYKVYGNKLPPIYGYKGLNTWITYFRCYDHVRLNPDASFGDAGKAVYGSQPGVRNNIKTYERAEQAVKRAHRLILAAEHKNWPPPIR